MKKKEKEQGNEEIKGETKKEFGRKRENKKYEKVTQRKKER